MEGRVVFVSDVPSSRDSAPFEAVPEVLTKREVAEVLGVAERTVSREIARGRLGCFHVGAAVRVTKQQLINYIEEASSRD